VPDEANKGPQPSAMEKYMPELQVNNLTSSVVETLRQEINAAIEPIAKKYGVRLRAISFGDGSMQAKWSDYSFRIPIEGHIAPEDRA
jgi:hypothetical protein